MYRNILRLTSLLVLLLDINTIYASGQGMFNVKAEKDKALYGYSFLNITEKSMERCMEKCLEHCRCLSFQMCENEECQLCSSNKEKSSSAFHKRKGCTYYAFQRDLSKVDNQQCQKSCSKGINCCMTSNPCKNKGTCKPTSKTDARNRFKCKCPDGYTGDRCQHSAKSCRSYIKGTRRAGKYIVLDKNMNPFHVFCDFDLNSKMAWTLIQSYQLRHKNEFKYSFAKNEAVNQDSPAWDSYRLSKERMEHIQSDSSKWRMTCQYDMSDGVVYTDYVQAANEKINILTYNDVACLEVEYIDIRGHNRTNCTTLVAQGNSYDKYPLHINSYYSKNHCTFQPHGSIPCTPKSGEDNFGLYRCSNPAHRCSATSTSTTQTWFGGY